VASKAQTQRRCCFFCGLLDIAKHGHAIALAASCSPCLAGHCASTFVVGQCPPHGPRYFACRLHDPDHGHGCVAKHVGRGCRPSRIKAAQKAAKEFLQELPPNVRVGIVSFAGNAQVVQHVTNQREELVAAIDRFQLQRGTATGSGLLLALATLRPEAKIDLEATLYSPNPYGYSDPSANNGGSGGAKSLDAKPAVKERPPEPPGSYKGGAIVLLSDGRRTAGPDPLMAAKKAADLGVRVYTVGFGTPNGFIPGYEGYSFYTQVDEESLKAVAKTTEADYFKAGSAEDLKKVYQHLSTQFTLEKRDTEITSILAGIALILILLAIALSGLWFKLGPQSSKNAFQ
jgi:Ca-activated chloride channel homolog